MALNCPMKCVDRHPRQRCAGEFGLRRALKRTNRGGDRDFLLYELIRASLTADDIFCLLAGPMYTFISVGVARPAAIGQQIGLAGQFVGRRSLENAETVLALGPFD